MILFINTQDAVLLLIDHQSGLLQTVSDIDIRNLRTNVAALAEAAKQLSIPVITTASEPNGPNGPLIKEVSGLNDATFIPRHGKISAWDEPDFHQTVLRTNRKTLLIAGIWTSVCVTFPALAALAENYNVYAVVDASGDTSTLASEVAIARMTAAGVNITTTNSVIAEMQKTWKSTNSAKFLEIYESTTPKYKACVESFMLKNNS